MNVDRRAELGARVWGVLESATAAEAETQRPRESAAVL